MSNKEYDGMQQLKEAELEAAKIEQEAKQGRLEAIQLCSFLIVRVARATALAEAREQAKKEVEEYRAEKEAKFQQKKEMVIGSYTCGNSQATGSGSQKEVDELSAETDKKIAALKQMMQWREANGQDGL